MSGRDNLRVAAAVKGVCRPRIEECLELVVLDEPANGLDPQGMREIREIIRILAGRGKTIFL